MEERHVIMILNLLNLCFLFYFIFSRGRRGRSRNGVTKDNGTRVRFGREEGAKGDKASGKSSRAVAIPGTLSLFIVLQIPEPHCESLLRRLQKRHNQRRSLFLPHTGCLFSCRCV